jgi:hypothetical protein
MRNRLGAGPKSNPPKEAEQVMSLAQPVTTTHVLFHTSETASGNEDRLIGLFRDAATACHVVDRLRAEKGFRESPQGFVIDEYKIDEDNWIEGFAWNDESLEGALMPSEVPDKFLVDPDPDLFVLQHRRVVGMHDVVCLIGVYSTRDSAEAAAARCLPKPGFRSFPHGFVIYALAVDRIHWTGGFERDEALRFRLLALSPSS